MAFSEEGIFVAAGVPRKSAVESKESLILTSSIMPST